MGDEFGSFKELETKLHSFKNVIFVELWNQYSSSITAAKKGDERSLKSGFKNIRVKYCCFHGDQN